MLTSLSSKRKGYFALIWRSGTGSLVKYSLLKEYVRSIFRVTIVYLLSFFFDSDFIQPTCLSWEAWSSPSMCGGAHFTIPLRSCLSDFGCFRLPSGFFRFRDITTGSWMAPRHSFLHLSVSILNQLSCLQRKINQIKLYLFILYSRQTNNSAILIEINLPWPVIKVCFLVQVLDSWSPLKIRCVLYIVGKQLPIVKKKYLKIHCDLGQLCESCPRHWNLNHTKPLLARAPPPWLEMSVLKFGTPLKKNQM